MEGSARAATRGEHARGGGGTELVGEDPSDDDRFREGTREVHHLYFDSPGGYKVGREMVDDGDDGWLLIDVGND